MSFSVGDVILKETPIAPRVSTKMRLWFAIQSVSLKIFSVQLGFGELHLSGFLPLSFLGHCLDSLFNNSSTPRLLAISDTFIATLSPLPSSTSSSVSRCQTPFSHLFVQLITITKLNLKPLSPAYTWLQIGFCFKAEDGFLHLEACLVFIQQYELVQ